MIEENDVEKLKLYLHSNLDDVKNYLDYDRTNLGVYCLKNNKLEMFEILRNDSNLNIFEKSFQGESCEQLLNHSVHHK